MPAVINPNEEDHPLVKAKARRVLQIAAHHNHYIPILGAWGCGVFGNSPEDIAKTFKDLIKGEFHGIFKKVLFAVPGRESHNYKMFNESLFSGV